MQSLAILLVLASLSPATAVNLRSASGPDVSAEVARESQQNIQIHDGFQAQEQKDAQTVSEVHANQDLSQLQQGTKGIKDPCEGISCAANLKCPAGFSVTEVEGHCCPYCVNPNIKLAAAITGATGTNGGKASTFCPKVWCFPTMCTKAISNPTSTNGLCCPACPAL